MYVCMYMYNTYICNIIICGMQAAIVCNEQFPVLSYSVAVEGLEGSLLVNVSDNTTAITVTLSRVDFPDFTVDQQYRVVINACTEFTCRRPPNPLIASTCLYHTISLTYQHC